MTESLPTQGANGLHRYLDLDEARPSPLRSTPQQWQRLPLWMDNARTLPPPLPTSSIRSIMWPVQKRRLNKTPFFMDIR